MQKVEYGDFYRFVASLGLALAMLAVAVPIAVLWSSSPEQLSQVDYDALTERSRNAIDEQYGLHEWLLRRWPWASVPLGVIGIALLLVGCRLWWYRCQVLEDTEKELTVETLKRSLPPVPVEDVEGRAAHEMAPEIAPSGGTESAATPPADEGTAIGRYFAIERALANCLRAAYGDEYSVLRQRRVGGAELDVVMLARSFGLPDYIIEVKYWSGHTPDRVLAHGATGVQEGAEKYWVDTGRRAVPVLAVVTSKGMSGESAERLNKTLAALEIAFPRVVALPLDEQALDPTADPAELRRALALGGHQD